MTSCLTVRSIASIRAGSSVSCFARIPFAMPAGTSPSASIASQAASSTSSQVENRVAGDQSSSNSTGV